MPQVGRLIEEMDFLKETMIQDEFFQQFSSFFVLIIWCLRVCELLTDNVGVKEL